MRYRATFHEIGNRVEEADIDPVILELRQQEERVVRACDKYLQRFDPRLPPIFAGYSYARFAAEVLDHYLDAEICCTGSRNMAGASQFPVTRADGISQVSDLIRTHSPDLVIGSSFERAICRDAAFVGIIPPLRVRCVSRPAPLAGINGTLSFIEHVLNACMDRKPLTGPAPRCYHFTAVHCDGILVFTFTLRMLTGYIPAHATPVYDRRWSCMMEKAGYLQQTRCRALDGEGGEHEVVDSTCSGTGMPSGKQSSSGRSPAGYMSRSRNSPGTGSIILA